LKRFGKGYCHRRQVKLGAMIGALDESEISEWVEENLAWSLFSKDSHPQPQSDSLK
jgi:hypothetical protein